MSTVLIIGSVPGSLVNFRGELIRELVERGHRVIGCASPPEKEGWTGLTDLGAGFVPVPFHRTGLNPLSDLATLVSLWGAIRRIQPDVVLSYTIKPVLYGSLCAALAGVPLIASMITGLGFAFTGENQKKFISRVVRELYRFCLRPNRVVFFQNPDDQREFEKLGLVRPANHPTLVNGSGVDLEHYAPRPLPPTPSFLMISRLIAEKGVRDYVAAARLVRARFPEARFRLAGMLEPHPNAVTREELEAWSREGVVEFLGSLADVRPALADAAVYVLPSFYREGVPRTVLEAMAMGRPVITTDAPGCRETVIEGENGFLIPVRNPEALAAAMEGFIRQPRLIGEMGACSRRLAAERFDVRLVNQRILERIGEGLRLAGPHAPKSEPTVIQGSPGP